MKHLDRAIAEIRAIEDPYARLHEADRLDAALVMARSALAQLKRDTVNGLRTPTFGYGGIAERLGLTKTRVQQIANLPTKFGQTAYAVMDVRGQWYGEPRLLAEGEYVDTRTPRPFTPADPGNPLFGQVLVVRCGEIEDADKVSMYTLAVLDGEDGAGADRSVRMTHTVQQALFEPTWRRDLDDPDLDDEG